MHDKWKFMEIDGWYSLDIHWTYIGSHQLTTSPSYCQVKRLTWEKLEEEPQKMLDDATCAQGNGNFHSLLAVGC